MKDLITHSCFCLKNGSTVLKNSFSNCSSENLVTEALKFVQHEIKMFYIMKFMELMMTLSHLLAALITFLSSGSKSMMYLIVVANSSASSARNPVRLPFWVSIISALKLYKKIN